MKWSATPKFVLKLAKALGLTSLADLSFLGPMLLQVGHMVSKKLPAIQFYPGDWRKDPGIQSLSLEERGLWFELLLLMWESPKRGYLTNPAGKPFTIDELCRLTGGDNPTLNRGLKSLKENMVYSVTNDGIIYNRRMVRDDEERLKFIEFGKKGGNPSLKTGLTPPLTRGEDEDEDEDEIEDEIEKEKEDEKEKENEEFNRFWNLYPRKVSIKSALKAFKSALKRESLENILSGLDKYSKQIKHKQTKPEYIAHASTWLNNDRWKDEYNIGYTPDIFKKQAEFISTLPD